MERILIVEDNIKQANYLADCINRFFDNPTVIVCNDYEKAYDAITNSIRTTNYFTLFLLDIQLTSAPGDRGGYILAEHLRKNKPYYTTPILFLTAILDDSKYALNTYHCYSYISKPYNSEDLTSILSQLKMTGLLYNGLSFTDTDRITHKVNYSDILYIKSNRHVTNIVAVSGCYQTRNYKIKTMIEQLPSNFVMCHKSYIINRDYVSSYDQLSDYIIIRNENIPIGRNYKKTIL